MYQGTINPVRQICSTCGGGPWEPQIQRQVDRFSGDTIVEAVYCCGRCGSKFANGIVEVIKKPVDEKK